jgi:superfamily II DNA or RNA helicase
MLQPGPTAARAFSAFSKRETLQAEKLLRDSAVVAQRTIRDVDRLTREAVVTVGRRRYEVVVILADEPVATCSCALGADCVHIAAVLLQLRDETSARAPSRAGRKSPTTTPKTSRPREPKGKAPPRVDRVRSEEDAGKNPRDPKGADRGYSLAESPQGSPLPVADSSLVPPSGDEALRSRHGEANVDVTPERVPVASSASPRPSEPSVPSTDPDVATVEPPEEPLSEAVEDWLLALDPSDEDRVRDDLPRYTLSGTGVDLQLEVVASMRVGLRASSLDRRVRSVPTLMEAMRTRHAVIEPIDYEIVAWVSARRPNWAAYHTYVNLARDGYLLDRLVQTGRAEVVGPHGTRARLRRGPSLRGHLGFVVDDRAHQKPSIRVPEASPTSLLVGSPPYAYLDFVSGHFGPLMLDKEPEVVEAWISGPSVPPGAVEGVRAELATYGLDGPKRVVVERRTHPLRVRVVSTPLVSGTPPLPRVEPYFEIDGKTVPAWAARLTTIETDEAIRVVTPDFSAVDDLAARLSSAGFTRRMSPSGSKLSHMVMPSGSPYEVEPIARDALVNSPWELDVADDYAFATRTIGDMALELADAHGGYRAGLMIDVDGQKVDVLPAVLASLATDKRFPRFSFTFTVGRQAISVPVKRLEGIRDLLLELADRGDGALVPRTRALALPPSFLPRAPESLAKLREELMNPRPVALPPTLEATLRPYQLDGFRWLVSRMRIGLGTVLADDMGLGKTVQAIALLLAAPAEGSTLPSLVVCPKSVAPNWADELRRFAPSLRVVEHHGKDRGREALATDGADIVLATYPILVMDEELFATARFSVVVLDEAQAIKNPRSTTAHAVSKLQAKAKIALTGTPFENNLLELWSLFRFVLPELLGEEKTFTRVFRRPIEMHADGPAREALRRRIFPFLLRRTKELVARELPEKTVTISRVELLPAQRDVYETVRAAMSARIAEALATKGLKKAHILVLDALLNLRQAACDPRLLRVQAAKRAPSAKLDHLAEMLSELVAEGRRVLVFSQFVTMLESIARELDARRLRYTVLTGQTEERGSVVREFQEGDTPIFLLSLKAGGTGLNLTAADVVIHFDPWWNPAAENQATDRAHRIGQDKPVFVYKLIGKDTIEEKILALQERKRDLFASVLEDGSDVASRLTEEDVRFLFS